MRKNLLIILLVCVGCCMFYGTSLAFTTETAPLSLINYIDNPNGFQIELNFPRGILTLIKETESESRLWFNTSGSIAEFESAGPALPVFTRLIAVPPGYRAVAQIISREEEIFDASSVLPKDEYSRSIREIEQTPMLEVGDPIWIRWLRAVPIVIRPAQYNSQNHTISATERMIVEIEFLPDDEPCTYVPDPERYYSQAFEEMFRAILLNPRDLPRTLPGGRIVQRGSYIIITDEHLAQYTADLVEWKQRKGFNVVVNPIYRHGITTDEVKDYIQDAYDNWERPPEFVLIIGDVNAANIRFPAYRYQNPDRLDERDVTDLPYVLLQGNDYFPDAFIGRISTDSPTSGVTRNVIQRIIDYEQQTYRPEIGSRQYENYMNCFNNATIFAGNFADGGMRMMSPVNVSRWLGERLREINWDVEEFYFLGHFDDPHDARPIIESLNNRSPNIFSYRGWGDANGAHFPQFHLSDLNDLDNGPLLPVTTFFVCNTGDFGNSNVNPCFGEGFIALGDRRDSAGGVAFFGPSDLYTKTRYNNPMFAGYYSGLMFKKQRVLGPLTLLSKMELWRGFPGRREPGNVVEFYYHIYNILGDPEINLFFDCPELPDVSHPEELFTGDTNLPITVFSEGDPIVNALINVKKEGETDISVLTDHRGIANVPVNLNSRGELQITVIGFQLVPYLTTIEVIAPETLIGFAGVEITNEFGDDRMVAGTPVEFMVSLRNFGQTVVNDVSARLSCEFNSVSFEVAEADYGDIEAGETAVADEQFRFEIEPRVWSWIPFPFYLHIEDADGNNWTAQFRVSSVSGVIQFCECDFDNGIIQPGETDNLVLTIRNQGPLGVERLRAELYSFDESVEMIVGEASFPALDSGVRTDNSDDPFQIRVRPETATGRNVAMRASLYDSQDRLVDRLFFNFTVGDPGPEDPLGPDGYGYYAYENIDDERYGDVLPEYDWIELDENGGTLHPLSDDSVFVTDLPFTFKYYGREYDQISICSNGWFSFGETWMYNFRNWGIPSPLGPHALVAPYWDDLYGKMQDGGREPLSILTRFDPDEGRYIIAWNEVIAVNSAEDFTETFQVILYNPEIHETPTGDGEIVFQYRDIEIVDRGEGNYATIGFEDYNHYRGLEFTFSNRRPEVISAFEPGRAIRITTRPPDPFLSSDNEQNSLPTIFALNEPYPNPFNSSTVLSFSLPQTTQTRISLMDINGRFIQEIAEDQYSAGNHSVIFNSHSLSSGIYLVGIETQNKSAFRKLLLIR
ncbi:MAG: T9SS type A sorting domain-containing protein [Calditrichaeota bacterium]|nr:T9SS type A sorting domain-containing protein [Calditrichota bacterium]